MEIDGEQLRDGGELVVQDDIVTNVTVDANTAIDLVEIRVDGEIQHSYRPENQSFSRAVPLDLGLNDNTIEVIANANDVSTFKTTVTKRTAAPRVKYSSPFSTTVKGGPNNETAVSSGQVTLAGTLHTISEVDRITIERTYEYNGSGGVNNTDRELYRITDPGDSFSQQLLLGDGENEIVARYIDKAGNTNKDTFRLVVDDATNPKVDLDVPAVSYSDTARVRATVSDETKLARVALNRTNTNASQVLLEKSDLRPDTDRLTIAVDTHVRLYNNRDTTNEFRLVAEDAAGNTKEKTFSVEYDSDPQVAISENATNATAETVHIAGNISKADVTRVTLETINTRSGERIDIARVYETGTATEQVAFNQTMNAKPGQTMVNLLITYDNGRQYTKSITPRVEERTGDTADTVESSGETPATVNAKTDNDEMDDRSGISDADTGSDTTNEPADDSETDSGGLPIPLGIGMREAFGGVIIVGPVYLLGNWV